MGRQTGQQRGDTNGTKVEFELVLDSRDNAVSFDLVSRVFHYIGRFPFHFLSLLVSPMVFGRAGFCHLFCSLSISMTFCWICISLVLAVFGNNILLELFVMLMMCPCWHPPLVLLD